MRRMFDFATPWPEAGGFGLAAPAVDITEDEKQYKIAAELPGMSEKNIEAPVSGDTLVIKGEKR